MKNALSALDDFCVATIRAAMQYVPAYMAILPKDRLVGAGSFEAALFLQFCGCVPSASQRCGMAAKATFSVVRRSRYCLIEK
jgi:hypothetical protein